MLLMTAIIVIFFLSSHTQTSEVKAASGPAYVALSAEQKMRLVWDNINANTTPSPLADINLLKCLMWPANQTFELTGTDELPHYREKLLFSGMGSVGKVEFVPTDPDNNYSGLFRGAQHGIIRVAQGVSAENAENFGTSTHFYPGLGLKFFRDGVESASLVAMYSIYGQDSWNVFAKDWSNHQKPLTGILNVLVGAKLATGAPHIDMTGLSDFALMGEDGRGVPAGQVNFPFKLVFRPTGEFSFPDNYHGPLHQDLATIPKGSVLWNVYAWDQPQQLGGQEQLLGAIVLRSEMVTSHWADTKLFFKHQDMRDDLKLKPEWLEHTHKWSPFSLGG